MNRGFTLMELVIAIAIIGILTAIAIPSYRDYVIRGQLVAGVNGLSSARVQMEQYFQDNRTYVATGTFTPPCSTAADDKLFTVSCTATPTATGYTITAVGDTGTGVAGFTYSIDQNNAQKTTGVPDASWG
ncbi:MAG: type IV pilin protein, partial [Stenotrophobium sp.]